MATSAISPGGGAPDAGILSGGGGDAELGSLLSSAFDSVTEGAGEAPAESSPNAAIAEPAQIEQPVQSEPVRQETQTQPEAQPQAGDSPYQLSPDGKFYQVPKSELTGFQAAHKFHQEVGRFFNSAPEAQAAYQQASDRRIMVNDFVSGDPSNIRNVVNYWAGNDHAPGSPAQQRFRQSFEAMAPIVAETLQRVNPQAFEKFVGTPARFDAQGNQISPASGTVLQAVELAYAHAAKSNNPDDFKRAQEFDYGATGTYKTELPRFDPQAAQLTQQQQQMREFEARQTAALLRDSESFSKSHVEGAKFKAFGDMIDNVLKPVKDRYPEKAYTDLKNGIHRELIDQMRAQHPEWWLEQQQNFQQIIGDYKTTWNAGNPGNGLQPRVQAYIQNFLSQAQRLLPSVAKERIGAATRAVVNRTQTGQFTGTKPQTAQPAARQTPAAPANGKYNPQGRMPADQWEQELAAAMRVG